MPSIELSGTIDPATEKWIGSALDDAADDDAPLAIIRLDTPGGLDTSMREIIQSILDAPMPVVVYVSPNGAGPPPPRVHHRGGGRGGDGAADEHRLGERGHVHRRGHRGHPGPEDRERRRAFIRALAQGHGRNGALAERMVTEAENVTAAEALDADAIDIVAASEEELLADLDGYEVQGPKAQTLDTAGFVIDERDMPLQYELLQILVNPTVAYLLLLVGLVGIAIEIFSPRLFIPGTSGWSASCSAPTAPPSSRSPPRESRCSSWGSGSSSPRPICPRTGSWAGSACSRSRYRGCCSSTRAPTRSRSPCPR